MSNTYAINTTRGKEFEVEAELQALGLKPWVPRILLSKTVKEKPEPIWYDRAYIPKLIFCVIPAVYWPDVREIKHIHGQPFPFSQRDIEGKSAGYLTEPKPNEHKFVLDGEGNRKPIPAIAGLKDFKALVDAEYADKERLMTNNSYQCEYKAGQALELIVGAFKGYPAVFDKVIKNAHDDYAKLSVTVNIMGNDTPVQVDPDAVSAICA